MKRPIIATLAMAVAAFASLPAAAQSNERAYWPMVPLMLPAGSEQGATFVRLTNQHSVYNQNSQQWESAAMELRITAVDDGGNVATPFKIRLEPDQALEFDSEDLTHGNAEKSIGGIGAPREGNWRLTLDSVRANQTAQIEAYIRQPDGTIAPMDDLASRWTSNSGGRGLIAYAIPMFHAASDTEHESRLRLINWWTAEQTVSIVAIDDTGERHGPVSLTLATGQSRTLTAVDLEQGAEGLEGALGDGTGKWRLEIGGVDFAPSPRWRGNYHSAVVAQNLLYHPSSGHLSSLLSERTTGPGYPSVHEDDHGDTHSDATELTLNASESGIFNSGADVDWFRFTLTEPGSLTFRANSPTPAAWMLLRLWLDASTDSYEWLRASESASGSRSIARTVSLRAGDYYLELSSSAIARYTVTTDWTPNRAIEDDHGNSIDDATELALGGQQTGNLLFGDVDYFSVVVVEAGTLTVYSTGNSVDTTGTLYDALGNQLAYNDDGGQNTNFRIERGTPAGTYFVAVRGFNQDIAGDYTVHAEFSPN